MKYKNKSFPTLHCIAHISEKIEKVIHVFLFCILFKDVHVMMHLFPTYTGKKERFCLSWIYIKTKVMQLHHMDQSMSYSKYRIFDKNLEVTLHLNLIDIYIQCVFFTKLYFIAILPLSESAGCYYDVNTIFECLSIFTYILERSM